MSVASPGAGAGITSVGNGALIMGNDVTVERPWNVGGLGSSGGDAVRFQLVSAANDGIASFGDGNVIAGNEVGGHFAGGAAVRVQGDANAIDSNSVHDASQAYAVVMIGDANTATSNEIADVEGEGVVVQGENGTVTDTHVRSVSSCGFLLVGSTRLEGCTGTGCQMGVVNLADGSSIVDSTVSGNAPYDVVDLGHATVSGDGVVGWIATDAASFPTFVPVQGQGFVPAETPRLSQGVPNVAAWR